MISVLGLGPMGQALTNALLDAAVARGYGADEISRIGQTMGS